MEELIEKLIKALKENKELVIHENTTFYRAPAGSAHNDSNSKTIRIFLEERKAPAYKTS